MDISKCFISIPECHKCGRVMAMSDETHKYYCPFCAGLKVSRDILQKYRRKSQRKWEA